MARGDQLARQWKIIQALIASRQGRSVPDLAEMVECHTRTVYRDLEALQAAGFPVTTERDGHRMVWSLLDPAKHAVPIPFSLPELMALYFGRRMVAPLKGTVFHDALESLFAKIRATLPGEVGRYLERLDAGLAAAPAPHKDHGTAARAIEAVNEAIARRRCLEMVYHSMREGKDTRRTVAPYRLLFFDGTFYLVGKCGLRQDIRVFALDRVRAIVVTETSFEPPEATAMEEFLSASFGIFHGPLTAVKVRFRPEVAGYIREKVWHASQRVTPQADGSILFEAQVAGTGDIRQWILRWGAGAEVLEPASLRDEMQREAQAMLSAYAPAGRGKSPAKATPAPRPLRA
jgi:predicted DNA-binding transcriptional regulator YafY